MSVVLEEFSKLRTELGGKLDTINAHLASFVLKTDHEQVRKDLEERVRRLEGFRSWAVGATAAIGVVGTVIGWALKAAIR